MASFFAFDDAPNRTRTQSDIDLSDCPEGEEEGGEGWEGKEEKVEEVRKAALFYHFPSVGGEGRLPSSIPQFACWAIRSWKATHYCTVLARIHGRETGHGITWGPTGKKLSHYLTERVTIGLERVSMGRHFYHWGRHLITSMDRMDILAAPCVNLLSYR